MFKNIFNAFVFLVACSVGEAFLMKIGIIPTVPGLATVVIAVASLLFWGISTHKKHLEVMRWVEPLQMSLGHDAFTKLVPLLQHTEYLEAYLSSFAADADQRLAAWERSDSDKSKQISQMQANISELKAELSNCEAELMQWRSQYGILNSLPAGQERADYLKKLATQAQNQANGMQPKNLNKD